MSPLTLFTFIICVTSVRAAGQLRPSGKREESSNSYHEQLEMNIKQFCVSILTECLYLEALSMTEASLYARFV